MAFALAEDVATRLGQTLTSVEAARVDQLLDQATGVIAAAADKSDQWAAQLDPVPRVIWSMTIELVVRSMRNPGGLRSQSESLGQFQHSETFRDDANGGGMQLSEVEESLVRRTIFGRTTGSVKTESVVHDLYPCLGS